MERSDPAVPGTGHAGATVDAATAPRAGAPRAALGLLGLAAVVALGAAWATMAGTLPGRRFGAPAAAVQGVLWAAAFGALVVAYRRGAAGVLERPEERAEQLPAGKPSRTDLALLGGREVGRAV